MKFIIRYILFFVFVFQLFLSNSQNLENKYHSKIDSLIEKYNFSEADSFINLSIQYKKSLQITNFGDEYYKYALIYKNEGLFGVALQKIDTALIYHSESNETYKVALDNLLKGKLYNQLENYIDAINVLKGSLITFIKEKDTFNIGVVKLNMGNIHNNMHNVEESANYYHEAIYFFRQKKIEDKVVSCYNNLGNLYSKTSNLDSAKYFYDKSLAFRIKTKNYRSISYLYHNYSNLYLITKDYNKALFYINKAIDLKKHNSNKSILRTSYIVKGEIYNELKNYSTSLKYLKLSLKDYNFKYNELQRFANLLIAKNYSKLKKYKESVYHFEQYLMIDDSINKRKNSSSLEQQFIHYEIIKDSLNRSELLLQKGLKEIEKSNLELKSRININNTKYLLVGLVLTFIFGLLLYLSSRKRLKLSNSHKKTLEIQNEELKRTLISKEEKETLLKEVHHRVKNNLQIINSLIRLQSHYMSPTNYKSKLVDIENRIRSMALVHEKLYKSGNLSKLDSEKYIIDLAKNILTAFEFKEDIKFEFNIQKLQLSIDTLIPLGLVINEIISNSIKYAFNGLSGGIIKISLSQKDNIELNISDNGIGADLTFNELSRDSLGMELIETLCEQLNGEFNLDTEKGFNYHFRFKKLD